MEFILKKRRKGEYLGTSVSTITNCEEKPVHISFSQGQEPFFGRVAQEIGGLESLGRRSGCPESGILEYTLYHKAVDTLRQF